MHETTTLQKCRLCQGSELLELFDFGKRPIAKRLLDTPSPLDESRYPVSLHVCGNCGFVQIVNVVPQEELYTNYTLCSSWKPQPHLQSELDELFKNNIISKDSFVIEIGCNDGIALRLLKQHGVENLLGIEPSRDVAKIAADSRLNVVNEYFCEETAKAIADKFGKADLIICRQVLEHISYLDSFMKGITGLIETDKHVLFEVPDFSIPLSYGDISAIWEEHVNYFTEDSLKHLLSHYGFEFNLIKKYDFSGGALCVIAKYTSKSFRPLLSIKGDNLRTILNYPHNVSLFHKKVASILKEVKESRGKIAIYGAGNRTVILLNYFLRDFVDLVVDDQPEKQYRFIPGCHIPIMPPDELIKQNIRLCLLAVNAENEDSVIKRNSAFSQSGGTFLSILSPSRLLIGGNMLVACQTGGR